MTPRLKVFLRLFLPAAVLVLLSVHLYTENRRNEQLSLLRASEMLHVGLGAAVLDRRVQVAVRDLDFLAGHTALLRLANDPGSPEIHRLEEDFIQLVRAKPIYDRIRWIDASGREVIRVDSGEGKPRLVPAGELQNKAERYYFPAVMGLPPGQLYVSPMDLSVDRGQIEKPYKPTLRLARSVTDGQGKIAGMVMLNYLGGEMFDYIKSLVPGAGDSLMVVNSEGYFLHSPDAGDEWGFMFNDPGRNLARRFPQSWQRMREEESGQFEDAAGLWTYRTVYPVRGSLPGRPEATADGRQAALSWQVILHRPAEQLGSLPGGFTTGTAVFALALLVAVAWAALALARSQAREKALERRFRTYFERAMVGMATTSPEKRWLAVNPALCKILGYPAEELLHKTWAELTHPDDLAANVELFERVLRGEADTYQLEKRFIRADGQPVETFLAAQAVRKPDGGIDYFVVIVEDISARIAAERQREQSLRTLQRFIDHLPGVAFVKDGETRVVVANRRFQDILGIDPQTMLGRLTEEVFPGESGRKFVADDRRVLASGRTEIFEEQLGGRDFETTKFPIPHDDGSAELGGISIEITARKQTQRLLDLQARRAAVLLELPQLSSRFDEREFMQQVLGYAEQLTGSRIAFMHFVGDDEKSIELVAWSAGTLENCRNETTDCHYPIDEAGIWADAARERRPVVINDYATAQGKHDLPAGHCPLVRLISVPVLDGGRVRMVTGIGNKESDYTALDVETIELLGNETWRIVRQQRADRALRIASQVVNASPVVCFRWRATAGWPVIFVSDNVVRWGYTVDDMLAGRPPFSAMVHPDDLPRVVAEVDRHTAGGSPSYVQEYRLLKADGQILWVVDRTNVIRNAAGEVEFYDGVLTDISERKRQEQQLAENLATQRSLNKRLEEANNQLLQSEKMASIGQLAAGIAHELNNPIGFVHSNLGTLDNYLRDLTEIMDAYEKMGSDPGAPLPQMDKIRRLQEDRDYAYIRQDIVQLLAESKDGLSRVRKIVQDLKIFSHVSEQEWQWADLHQGLDSTLNIVWNELKYKCKVVKEYGNIPKVHCLISQLNQVFMNLMVNASHAIEKQGVITLRTRRHGDGEVCIEVADTGKGIAPEHLTRIFEPFFTTKPVGKGTGLGLSLSYGIVDKHHGRIEVESVVAQGTTFRVIIPIDPEASAAAGHSTEAPA